VRYKVWRSNKDKELHLLCAEGVDAFEALPTAIRNLGPSTGSKEGEADRLRLPYRSTLTEQGFTIVYAHISKFNLEAPTGPPVLRGQAECPDCKGSGQVDQHGGLRKKDVLAMRLAWVDQGTGRLISGPLRAFAVICASRKASAGDAEGVRHPDVRIP
jgi:hypothetical protein